MILRVLAEELVYTLYHGHQSQGSVDHLALVSECGSELLNLDVPLNNIIKGRVNLLAYAIGGGNSALLLEASQVHLEGDNFLFCENGNWKLGNLESSSVRNLLVQELDFLGLKSVDGGGVESVLVLLELLVINEALVSLDSGVDLGDHGLGRESSGCAHW